VVLFRFLSFIISSFLFPDLMVSSITVKLCTMIKFSAFVAIVITALGSCSRVPFLNQFFNEDLELVYTDDTYQLTGVAKEPQGRLFVNYPRWNGPYKYAVVQATAITDSKPYPDVAMNEWQPGQPGKDKWVCVQSVYIDDDLNLWVLDPAAPQMKTIQDDGPKLVKMNKSSNTIEKSYFFNEIVPDTAYVNDVRIDVKRQFAYLTESKGGGIIVLDLATSRMRRVLSQHYSTKSDPSFKFIIDGHELMKNGKPVKINSDGIALTPEGEWLYYKTLTDDKLYRIKTEALRDWSLNDAELGKKVEDLGHYTTTDGMIFDEKGNLYLGDLQNYRIVKIDKDLKMSTVVHDRRLIWPDSYSIADGFLYISCSQIQKQPEYNNGINKRITPYTIYRWPL
jgi:sugar lactone lactonase YvrE